MEFLIFVSFGRNLCWYMLKSLALYSNISHCTASDRMTHFVSRASIISVFRAHLLYIVGLRGGCLSETQYGHNPMHAYPHLPGPPGSSFYFFPQVKAFLTFVERDISFLLAPVLSWFISMGISKSCGIRWTLPASSCWYGSSKRRSWREVAVWSCSYTLSCVGVVVGVAHLEIVCWGVSLSCFGGGGFHKFLSCRRVQLSWWWNEENSHLRPIFKLHVIIILIIWRSAFDSGSNPEVIFDKSY